MGDLSNLGSTIGPGRLSWRGLRGSIEFPTVLAVTMPPVTGRALTSTRPTFVIRNSGSCATTPDEHTVFKEHIVLHRE